MMKMNFRLNGVSLNYVNYIVPKITKTYKKKIISYPKISTKMPKNVKNVTIWLKKINQDINKKYTHNTTKQK